MSPVIDFGKLSKEELLILPMKHTKSVQFEINQNSLSKVFHGEKGEKRLENFSTAIQHLNFNAAEDKIKLIALFSAVIDAQASGTFKNTVASFLIEGRYTKDENETNLVNTLKIHTALQIKEKDYALDPVFSGGEIPHLIGYTINKLTTLEKLFTEYKKNLSEDDKQTYQKFSKSYFYLTNCLTS